MISPITTGEQTETMCAACGRPGAARWTLYVESDDLCDVIPHRAAFRLCEDDYRRLMTHMLETRDYDANRPLRGYT